MARNGPTPAQFDNAKRYLTGSYLLDFDTNAKVANSLLRHPARRRRARTTFWRATGRSMRSRCKDVRRVAEHVLKPDRLVVTIVGKPKLER